MYKYTATFRILLDFCVQIYTYINSSANDGKSFSFRSVDLMMKYYIFLCSVCFGLCLGILCINELFRAHVYSVVDASRWAIFILVHNFWHTKLWGKTQLNGVQFQVHISQMNLNSRLHSNVYNLFTPTHFTKFNYRFKTKEE